MSTGSQVFPKSQSPDVLGALLHSLNQPLTSLRCALALSIEDVREQQQKSMLTALQQTEEVIGAVQLMREYLDADQAGTQSVSCALVPVLVKLTEELSTVAAIRGGLAESGGFLHRPLADARVPASAGSAVPDCIDD